MLGRFLELSIATPDVRASLAFYVRLGFSAAAVGETWSHPYAVVTDGRIHLGLHQQPDGETCLTFVKPNLLAHLTQIEAAGAQFEFRRLGNDVFNEVGWRDPSGLLLRLLEARTFSPVERRALDTSACGYFVEIALPVPQLDASKHYWEGFGFVGMDEPDARWPHVACTSDTIDIGLYEVGHLREPTLRFEVDDVGAALTVLGSLDITPTGRLPAPLRGARAALLIAPEGTPILVTAPDAWI